MSQFTWEGIFGILNVLVPGGIMTLFAAYYQNRRKREIKIEGKIAIDRIDGYEKILSKRQRLRKARRLSVRY